MDEEPSNLEIFNLIKSMNDDLNKKIDALVKYKIPLIEKKVSDVDLATKINYDKIENIETVLSDFKAKTEAEVARLQDITVRNTAILKVVERKVESNKQSIDSISNDIDNENDKVIQKNRDAEIENLKVTLAKQESQIKELVMKKSDNSPDDNQKEPPPNKRNNSDDKEDEKNDKDNPESDIEKEVTEDKDEENERRKSIIHEARKVVGIYPIKEWHITKFIPKEEDINEETIENLYKHPKYYKARLEAAREFLDKEMNIRRNSVEIVDCWSASSPSSLILWIKTSLHETTEIYRRRSRIRNSDISLITYTPTCLWDRKVELERLCHIERSKDRSLRTQVRIGESDVQLWTKKVREPFYNKINNKAFGPLPPYGSSSQSIESSSQPPSGRSPPPNPLKRKDRTPPPTQEKRGREESPPNLRTEISSVEINNGEKYTMDNNKEVEEEINNGVVDKKVL